MTVRIAGIGLGGLGRLELEQFDEMDGVEVAAGVDPSVPARDKFIETFDAPVYETTEELLAAYDDLDGASVASVHTAHFEQAMACLDAGIDVHVEKPMVTTVEEAVALVDAVTGTDRVVQVGYQRRFDPRHAAVRRLIDDGEIGVPRMAHCYLQQEWMEYAQTWRGDPSLSGGGFLYDSGSHLMDALPWMLDADPVEVAALTEDRGEGVEIDAAISARLEREDGTVTTSAGVCGDGTRTPDVDDGITVYGTEGSIHFDGRESSAADSRSRQNSKSSAGGKTVELVERGGETRVVETEGDADFETVTRKKLENFVAAIRGEETVAAPPEHGLRAMVLTEAACRAAERGETVDARALVDAARTR
jgi:predicted dehydrogenase